MKDEVKEGLVEIRGLVNSTHWIQGSYLSVEYNGGDGEYADGSVVENKKVIGCLVGLSRLVGAKLPTYVEGVAIDLSLAPPTALSKAMDAAIRETIVNEFLGPEYVYIPDDDEDGDPDWEPEDDTSIEGWNDRDERTRDQVLEMLDRAIERLSLQEAGA